MLQKTAKGELAGLVPKSVRPLMSFIIVVWRGPLVERSDSSRIVRSHYRVQSFVVSLRHTTTNHSASPAPMDRVPHV